MNKPSYCPGHQSKWKLGTYRKPRHAENHASLPGPCGAVVALCSKLDKLETDAEKLRVEVKSELKSMRKLSQGAQELA